MPNDYGIPKDKKGLLPWSHVSERMAEAKYYWVSTVDSDGRPHATPVDGLWIDERLYFGGSPKTKRNRNLAVNPAVCIHLESAGDVVILHGEAIELRNIDVSLSQRLADASKKKYGYAPPPEAYSGGGSFVVRPRMILAWKQFPKDVTRWQFATDD
jgi:nitroimidazol reductase NimA-like FMN-containing flavoprotein (pyridoxamine 5'-phosphate oxidase superfamily)